jgi:type IV pilus assembly protein PilM
LNFAEYRLPKGAVVDGEISEIDDVAETLKKIWSQERFGSKNVVLGIANTKVLVRQIELPFMEDEALRGAINFQAQEYIPIPPEDLVLDYQVVGEFTGEDNQRMIEVLLVGAHREMINKFCIAAEKAGLHVDTVYLSSLALVRSLMSDESSGVESNDVIKEDGPQSEEEPLEQPTVLVNSSADITNIVVVEKGVPRFARIMAFGGNDFTEGIMSATNSTFEEAEEIKRNIGLKTLDKSLLENEKVKIASDIIKREAFKYADELKRSIEYYFGQELGKLNIKKLIISGGGSEMIDMDQFLLDSLKIPIEKGRPLRQLQVAGSLKDKGIESQELTLAVVIGLALRGLEDL